MSSAPQNGSFFLFWIENYFSIRHFENNVAYKMKQKKHGWNGWEYTIKTSLMLHKLTDRWINRSMLKWVFLFIQHEYARTFHSFIRSKIINSNEHALQNNVYIWSMTYEFSEWKMHIDLFNIGNLLVVTTVLSFSLIDHCFLYEFRILFCSFSLSPNFHSNWLIDNEGNYAKNRNKKRNR